MRVVAEQTMSRGARGVAGPGWGVGGGRREVRRRAARRGIDPPRLAPAARPLSEVAGATLVMGGTVALWWAFLVAVW